MPANQGQTVKARATRALPGLSARTRMERAAPKTFTGCVSAISACGGVARDYRDALKQYAAAYEAYQAYLTPRDPLAGHVFGAAPAAPADTCLPSAIECDASAITDDEVEGCGYLGWLRH